MSRAFYEKVRPSRTLRAAERSRKNKQIESFKRFRSRRRVDRAKREFLALTDQTAWQLIDRLALGSESGTTARPISNSTPDLDRLNVLLEELKNSAIPDRMLHLWVCIRRYDHLCMVVNSCREAAR